MSTFSKGHHSRNIRWFFKNFNQVIYSSSPISRPSFKPLAQILFEISSWQDYILIFSMGHNSRKGDNSDKKKNMGQLFFHEESIYKISKPLHAWFIKYGMHQMLFWFFQRGITPEREITLTRKKTCVSYFSMRNPYMKFQNPSMHGS